MKTQKLSARRIENTFNILNTEFPKYEPPGGLAMDVGLVTSKLRDIAKTLGDVKKTLMERYALRDTSGNPIEARIDKDGNIVERGAPGEAEAKPLRGSMQVAPENLEAYNKELDEAYNKEYDVETVEVSAADIRALPKFNSAVAEALLPFISYAPPEDKKK